MGIDFGNIQNSGKGKRHVGSHHVNDDLKCLNCLSPLEMAASTDEDNDPPQPGNISVCVYCGCVSQFAAKDDGTLYLIPFSSSERERMKMEEPREYEKLLHLCQLIRDQNKKDVNVTYISLN